jgi:hypothetical protein
MPRREYPRSRRIWMQATLCVVFAGSVALAQLVVVHHRGSRLATPVTATAMGPIKRMSLPTGWVVRSHDKSPVFLIDQEPDKPDMQGRTLTGSWEQLPKNVPVREYLQTSQLSDPDVRVVSFANDADEEIQMGDGTGVVMATTRSGGTGVRQIRVKWIACTVRPDGKAITLELDCPENSDPEADKQTLIEWAQSMEFRN